MSAAYTPKRFAPASNSTSRYVWNWSKFLIGLETAIQSYEFVDASPTLTVVSDSTLDGKVTAFIQCGTEAAYIGCRITTIDGDITTRTIAITPRPL